MATVGGWLWDKTVVAALAFFPWLPQLSVCSLSGGGTFGHVISEAGLLYLHAIFSPTLSPAYTSTVQKGCFMLTRTMKTVQEIPRMNAVCHSTEKPLWLAHADI